MNIRVVDPLQSISQLLLHTNRVFGLYIVAVNDDDDDGDDDGDDDDDRRLKQSPDESTMWRWLSVNKIRKNDIKLIFNSVRLRY